MLQTPGCRDCSAEPRPLDCRNAGGAPEEKFWPATWPATSYVNQSTAAQYGSPVRRPGGVDCLGNTGPRNRLRPALPSDGVLICFFHHRDTESRRKP